MIDSELSNFDIFYFWDQRPENYDLEMSSDVLLGLVQPKRSMFYNRLEGAGIDSYENAPMSALMQVKLPYDIVNWSAYRNAQVPDGSNGTIDRRIAISQSSVNVSMDSMGNLDIQVNFYRLKDLVAQTVGNKGKR